jgi:hypothetical protein
MWFQGIWALPRDSASFVLMHFQPGRRFSCGLITPISGVGIVYLKADVGAESKIAPMPCRPAPESSIGRAGLRRGQFVAELDYGRSIAQKSLRPDPVA